MGKPDLLRNERRELLGLVFGRSQRHTRASGQDMWCAEPPEYGGIPLFSVFSSFIGLCIVRVNIIIVV